MNCELITALGSWPQVAVVIAAAAVPFFIWRLKVGRARERAEMYSRSALMQSAVDKAWEDSSSEGNT